MPAIANTAILQNFDPTKDQTFPLVRGYAPPTGSGDIAFLLEGTGGGYIAEQSAAPSVTSFVVHGGSVNPGASVSAYIEFRS